MKVYFNEATQGFYHEGIQDEIPAASVEISNEDYQKFYNKICEGFFVRIVNSLPIYEKIVLTPSSEQERVWRNSELIRADIELYKVQDADSKAVGSVAVWRDYRKALRAWPEHPDFPNKSSRPVSP